MIGVFAHASRSLDPGELMSMILILARRFATFLPTERQSTLTCLAPGDIVPRLPKAIKHDSRDKRIVRATAIPFPGQHHARRACHTRSDGFGELFLFLRLRST